MMRVLQALITMAHTAQAQVHQLQGALAVESTNRMAAEQAINSAIHYAASRDLVRHPLYS